MKFPPAARPEQFGPEFADRSQCRRAGREVLLEESGNLAVRGWRELQRLKREDWFYQMEVRFLRSAFHESQYPPADKPEIAFAGRSNVGKSSLINILVNRKRLAKTSSTPGRTQAINFFCLDNRLYLVDLPGYGYARVPLQVKKSWGKMVETYLRKRANLKAVVVILDIRRDPSGGDLNLINWLNQYGKNATIALTKADKLSRHQRISRAEQIGIQLREISGDRPTIFSAKTKEGKAEIWEKIRRLIEIENLQGHRP